MVWIASSFLLAMTKTQLTKTDAADVGELRVDCRHTAGECPLLLPRTHRERFQKRGLCRQLQRRAGEVGQERLVIRSFCRVDDFPTPLTVSPDRVDYGETIGAKKTKRLAPLRFRCFHNGIILIVNCFIFVLQKYKLFVPYKKKTNNFVFLTPNKTDSHEEDIRT